MTNVVFDRPYQYVPPHRGNYWPSLIQTFRIVDWYLKRKEGVSGWECRDLDYLRESVDRGDGVLLAPNHCRYADPLVLGWPARELGVHVYAMASWHLFNKSIVDSFAIRKMGAFSVNRESADRKSLETAIGALATAERPLILFPEGTTNRTNDVLKPLLDGVAFIARSAARRRSKQCGGQVVMHPIGIKYLCEGDISDWANHQLTRLETHLGWRTPINRSIVQRAIRLAEGLLCLKEVEYFGESRSGELPQRRDALIEHVLQTAESQLGIESTEHETRARVRAIRSGAVSQYFDAPSDEQAKLRSSISAAELAQELMSYPDCYLQPDHVTDTRIVETIQRMQESLLRKADTSIPLRAVIQCDKAITIPAEKSPRGIPDPLTEQLRERLTSMLAELSTEARQFPYSHRSIT